MQHEKNQILEQAFNADTNVDDLEGLLAKTQELQTKIQDNVTSVPFTKDKVVIPKNMLQMLFKSIKTLINRIFSILNMNHRLDVSNRSLIRENRHLREALDKSNGRLKVLEDNSTIPDLEASNQELVNVIDHMVDKEEMLYKENNHIKHYLSIHDKLSDKDIGRITKTGNVKDRNRSF